MKFILFLAVFLFGYLWFKEHDNNALKRAEVTGVYKTSSGRYGVYHNGVPICFDQDSSGLYCTFNNYDSAYSALRKMNLN